MSAGSPTESGDAENGQSITVTFAVSGLKLAWDPDCDSILELAEGAGMQPDFSCRAGICNTCECDISSGSVRYLEEPLMEPEEGRALICCSVPDGDVTLEL